NELSKISNLVAPDLHNIGLMLPYSGIHYLLFDNANTDAFVMSSANFPGNPMIIDEGEAMKTLKFVDYYLIHNRKILNRIDDTVIRLIGSHKAFIRRSRGFVPTKIKLPFKVCPTIGVGAELNNTIAIANDTNLVISQYIGNTKHINSFKFHNQVVNHIQKLTNITPIRWGCDLHPLFNTTKFAELKKNSVKVQHHYAHIISLMVDNSLPIESNIIGIALDGMGYGDDGTLWGGEILESSYFGYKRHAHIMPQPMAGGDLASLYPSRMVYGMLYEVLDEDELKNINLLFKYGDAEKDIVLQQLKQNVNIIKTSGTGRVLDAAAAILGIANYRSYDGESAMKLESFAKNRGIHSKTQELPIKFKNGMLDTTNLLYSLYEMFKEGKKQATPSLSFAFEESLAIGIAELSIKHAKKRNIDIIGLSGGVALNEHITETIRKTIEAEEFEFIVHKNIPCGDGGISVGQAVSVGVKKLI
ncbi:MAG: Sua5/YciO/YrdC/YwlC family protein, partial [Methanosarcinaceae archaeon]|nr:Sua5/YciO/YrdC/YwlC family protein [Methanosarcinaceae archaeon]